MGRPKKIRPEEPVVVAPPEITTQKPAQAIFMQEDRWLYHPQGPEIFDRPYRGRIFLKGEPRPDGWSEIPVKGAK